MADSDRKELVVMGARMFPHPIHEGYDPQVFAVVEKVNDQPVKSLLHLVELIRSSEGEFIIFNLAGNYETLIFPRQEMFDMLAYVMPLLPEDKPNHLLGIGDTYSMEQCIKLGIDTFDSSHPTRCARHGLVFSAQGDKKILNSSNKHNFKPIDQTCTCMVCQHYTVAYLHHLFKANEMTGYTLASMHNVHFMVQLMAEYRRKILEGEL